MIGSCDVVWYDERKQGRPIWGTGARKADITGYHDGWTPCTTKTRREVEVDGRQRLVCELHELQVDRLRGRPELLQKLRWRA
jgi:hypothetical protein